MGSENDLRFVRVCAVTDVPKGKGKGFKVGKLELAVFHTEDGFFATDDICSHEREHLAEGWLEAHTVECPRHGSVFDLRTGEAESLPATEPILVFRIEIDGNDLKVGIPAEWLDPA
jgi:3-phenylpropionate/trans-cinnamate dioxygenase ferredoxin component